MGRRFECYYSFPGWEANRDYPPIPYQDKQNTRKGRYLEYNKQRE
ncbi:hypothetical protein [Methanosarcina acetivorans]|nr:hypothetical protein [Methanosarcina acetivorans]